jgi:hypothetical protein
VTTRINWLAAVGGTPALLQCVPGLKAARLRKWMQRDRMTRRGAGTGNKIIWHAEDVAEIALRFEVAHLGALADKDAMLWFSLKSRITARMFPSAHDREPKLAFVAVKPASGELLLRWCDETDEADGGFDRDNAPSTVVVIRIDHLLDRVAERIAKVAPGAVVS